MPLGCDGLEGTRWHVEERPATGGEMVRNPDESQGQNADPETHASGIPSINDPVVGLVVGEDTVKKDGEEILRNSKGGV